MVSLGCLCPCGSSDKERVGDLRPGGAYEEEGSEEQKRHTCDVDANVDLKVAKCQTVARRLFPRNVYRIVMVRAILGEISAKSSLLTAFEVSNSQTTIASRGSRPYLRQVPLRVVRESHKKSKAALLSSVGT